MENISKTSSFNCSVAGCDSVGISTGRKYFKYPLHTARAREWLKLTGRLDLVCYKASVLHYNYLVCDLHFEEYDIIRSHISNTGKPKLKLPTVPLLKRNLIENSEIDENIKIRRLSEVPSTSSQQAREDKPIPSPETETSDELKSSEDEFEDDTDFHELEESIKKQILGDEKNTSDALCALEETKIKPEEQSENLEEDSFLKKMLVGSKSYQHIYDDQMTFLDDIATKSLQTKQTELFDNASLQPQNTAIIENVQHHTDSKITLKEENVVELTDTESIEYENEQNSQPPTDHSLALKEKKISENYENLQTQTENFSFNLHSETKFTHSELKMLKHIQDLEKNISVYRNSCRNEKEFNFFAFNLCISCPTTYKVIRNTFQLPEIKTLRSIKIDVSSRLNVKVLQCLKSKYQKLLESDKVCVINADIIPLRRSLYYYTNKDKIIGFHEINDIALAQPATTVLVLMARGIASGWKQILAYCYLENFQVVSVSKWIEEVISEMQEIGFIVVAFTSKYKTILKDLWADKNKTCSLPSFDVNGKKILYTLDISDLLVAMRDVFVKHNIKFTDPEQRLELIASWADVLNLYRLENNKKKPIAPKLTLSHVMPKELEQSKFLKTIQVFSKSVAEAIKLYVEVNELNETSLGTAKFIELVNNLFDALNTSADITQDEIKLACQSIRFQLKIIENFVNVCSTMTIVNEKNNDNTDSITCFENFKTSLQSIGILINGLMFGYDFKVIHTRHLIQEPLDKFTEKLVKNYKIERSNHLVKYATKKQGLTAIRFEIAFRKQFVNDLLNNSRCKRKFDNLENLVKNAEECISLNNLDTEINDTDLGIRDITNHRFNYVKGRNFFMFCIFLLQKCHEIDTCVKMKHELPTQEFVDFVKVMDTQIVVAMGSIFAGQVSGVGRHLYESLSELKFDAPCDCFPLDYLKKLFVRFTIYDMIKFNNKFYANSPATEHGFVRTKM